jgi:hypothetical protein
MNVVRYLPSAQFVVIVGSIALSGGLVIAAQQLTHHSDTPSTLTPSQTIQPSNTDWLAALKEIEGSSILATTTPDAATTNELLKAAKSSNVTDSVAHTLLVSLANAKSQGLGSDIPTQDKLVAEAAAQIEAERGAPAYTEDDVLASSDTAAAEKEYGNRIVEAITAHSTATYQSVILAVGNSGKAPSKDIAALGDTQKEYVALAQAILKVPVPPKLIPLHLQIANNLAKMGSVLSDVRTLYADPLRALAGFQLFEGLNSEVARLFTNVGQRFAQDGILFTKDEPGDAWNSFLSI